jgi:leader peptidase (prepilin peptidase)/N-methyltransferase
MTHPDEARLAGAAPALAAAAPMIAASLVVAPSLVGVLGAALALVMLAIAIVDARYYVIPDELGIAAVVIGIGHALLTGSSGARGEALGLALARGLAVGAAFFLLREAYFRLRRRQGLGLGDVKLSVVAGVWLGFDFVVVATEIAALSAIAVLSVRRLVLHRPLSATERIPFGLYFAPAIWLAWVIEGLSAAA